MKEIELKSKKNGMPVLLLTSLLLLVALAGVIVGPILWEEEGLPFGMVLFVISLVVLCVGWIPYLGLRVLKPQEALVLTLFGKYIGTLRGDGFYAVNPFCVGVNPAADTELNQSGDVKKVPTGLVAAKPGAAAMANKKISLKVMTLNNNRQKINDCLGNPVEIGIAVTWRIVDTAKAVFNVDNYKEFLSLQCDTALRNIVRIYPYDVAPASTPRAMA